jgi:hypothetical protein
MQKVVTHQGRVVMAPVDKDGNVVPKESAAFVGEVPLIEHEYSDTLLIFLMKGADPRSTAVRVADRHDTHPAPSRSPRTPTTTSTSLRGNQEGGA